MLVPVIGVTVQLGVGAAAPSSGCGVPTARDGNVTATHLTSAQVAALGAQKAEADARNPQVRADLQRAQAISDSPADKMRRAGALSHTPVVSSNPACGSQGQGSSLLQRIENALGTSASAIAGIDTGSGWAQLVPLNQQGQINGYYCGPATVSESSYTEYVPVSQQTAGSYMGTTTNGTNVSNFVDGMNHFVGVPVYGWNYYIWVNVPYTPSSSDAQTFWDDLEYDVSPNRASVLGGDAYEVTGGPHLTGHPNENIFHYFEIGGWNTNTSQVYYADSATTVWSTVPAYSWFDQWTMVVILGGRGYVW
jgi:hypothetical protein